jgi:hypothetical protein
MIIITAYVLANSAREVMPVFIRHCNDGEEGCGNAESHSTSGNLILDQDLYSVPVVTKVCVG